MTPLSRRELIAAFLGTGAAWMTGCGSAPSNSALPPGELVGASSNAGHLLRGPGVSTGINWSASRHSKVMIAGGGVAGLSAAWRFLRAGFTDFTLLELEPEVGGTARSGESSVTRYPWGAHYLPAPRRENRALVALLDEMGILEGVDAAGEPVAAEQFRCRDPEERIFHDGQWSDGLYLSEGADAEDTRQFAAFKDAMARFAAWRDGKGRRAFDIPISRATDDPEITSLDRVSMAEYLDRHGYTSPRLRWSVDYACRDDYGLRMEQTSAWAGIFYFAARWKESEKHSQQLLTWPEGNGRLVRHLAAKAAQHIQKGLLVREINPAPAEGLQIAAVENAGTDAPRFLGFNAERVVFAMPQFLARHVIRPYREAPPAHLAAFDYGAWMVANLHLKNRPVEHGYPLCWDNVIYDSPSLGYVVATHQRGIDHGPSVFTYYYPLCDPDPRAAREQLLAAGRDEWAEVALSDLSVAHPDLRGLTERLDVMRWGHAMIRPKPNFIWSGARQKAMQPYRGIHFAHSDLSGVALFEEAFQQGIRAAEEILAELGVELKERLA